MKNKYLFITTALTAALGITACSPTMGSFNTIGADQVGVVSEDYPATIVSAQSVTQETSNTARNLGTLAGAAIGAGAGSLLGKGSGNVVSTVGFGLVGAALGRYTPTVLGGETQCQRLTVRVDGSKKTYTVTQPVYKEIGALSPGQRGTLRLASGKGSVFVPDGY